MIKFVAVEIGMKPYILEAKKEDVTLEWLRQWLPRYMGGRIEVVPSLKNPGLDLIINKDGKIIPLLPNRRYGNDILFGGILVVAHDNRGRLRGLSKEEIKKAMKEFSEVDRIPYDIDPFDYPFDFNRQDGEEKIEMKKYFEVTFKYLGNIYCTNIAHAEIAEAVERHYKNYEQVSIRECSNEEVEIAKRKGMPIVEVEGGR